ncbi:MAG: DNA topoisomerase III [Thermincolia bacterium]
MKLIIAEKPSVARDIAKVLGKFASRDGCLENQQYIITWAIGHLVELAQPEDYDSGLKLWSLGSLPIVPQEFRLQASRGTYKQFKVVKELLARRGLDEVINACDAGREGELIFRYIYQLASCKLPIKRLWISSLTDEAILAGFQALRDGQQFEALAQAARCRSESDWLVGINGTRGFTKKCGTLLSIGRVQTPTLAILVKREKEIQNFVSEPYWQVEAVFTTPEGKYKGLWFGKGKGQNGERLDARQDAEVVAAKVKGQSGRVVIFEQKEQKQSPPLLFDLTELQREMNKRFGFAASKTLKVAQSLYEEVKLITYPRTDSRYISKDMVKTLPGILRKIGVGEYRDFCQDILGKEKLLLTPKAVNDGKVTDHHAIIPTGKTPNLQGLSKDQLRVYDAVVRRFLANFFPSAVLQNTTVVTGVAGETFRTKQKVVMVPGWRAVYGGETSEDEVLDFPPLAKGIEVTTVKAEVLEKETKPPNRYTEASLLSAMETAGKLVEDEELREAMKHGGLGTPATRAAIIERLIKVGYVERQKKNLIPTEKGIRLIQAIPVPELISPELTGSWEKKLAHIQQGTYTRTEFMKEITAFVRRIVEQVKTMGNVTIPDGPAKGKEGAGKSEGKDTTGGKGAPRERKSATREVATAREAGSKQLGLCPRCGGVIIQGKKGYGCSNWKQGCDFVIWMEMAGKKLTLKQVQTLLDKKNTGLIKGFKAPNGTLFAASLVIKEGRVTFEGGKES